MPEAIITNKAGREFDAAEHAKHALESWSRVMAAEDVPDVLTEPLRSLAEWYEVSTAYVDSPQELWERIKPVLEARAEEPERPEPQALELDAIKEARARTKTRRVAPAVSSTLDGRLTSPHADQDGWGYQLCDVFGTRSLAATHAFIGQLSTMLSVHGREADVTELNAALAIVSAAKPKNEMQAALAVSAAALQVLGMRAAAQAARSPHPANLSAFARCVRAQAETVMILDRLQNRNRTVKQTFVVKTERHEHKHVHMHQRTEGGADFRSQAHAPNTRRGSSIGKLARLADGPPPIEHQSGSEMWSEDPERERVPVPRREGEPAL